MLEKAGGGVQGQLMAVLPAWPQEVTRGGHRAPEHSSPGVVTAEPSGLCWERPCAA